MKPLYLQVFYTFKIHSCQAILIILLYVLLNSDPLSGDILHFWQCSPKKLQFISKLCGWTKMYLLWIRGNLLIYCFGALIPWQSLLALNFQRAILMCSISVASEVSGWQLESSCRYRGLEPLLAFIRGQSLQHCPFLCQWPPCDPLQDIPSALKDPPGKEIFSGSFNKTVQCWKPMGVQSVQGKLLAAAQTLLAGGILFTEIREFQNALDWKGT